MLVNKVANSKLITINLENYYPKQEIISLDLKDYLFREIILREKEFRNQLEEYDWTQLQSKNLVVFCSVDAIIPTWAYMLIAVKAQPYVQSLFFGTLESFVEHHYRQWIKSFDFSVYQDALIVVKGCSEKSVPPAIYAEFSASLSEYAKSIMFGEPCSTVPVYKKKNP
jgi:hypothetical protein